MLGMDCGTTNIKAVILGEDGTIAAEASRGSTPIRPGPHMQEQDANEWWHNAVEIFRSLSEQAGEEVVKGLRGICVSSHTVTLLPVSQSGAPLRNAILYSDNRSTSELDEIVRQMGLETYINDLGGQPAVSFLPGKLLWYKRHEPELMGKTAKFLQASSYINLK